MIFFDATKTFFLPELSFTFAVNFFKGEIYFQKKLLILSKWYHEYIKKIKIEGCAPLVA